jgi:hypothetical protein
MYQFYSLISMVTVAFLSFFLDCWLLLSLALLHCNDWSLLELLSVFRFVIVDRHYDLVVRVPGYRTRGPGFDSRRYHNLWEVVGLEWGPIRLVSTIEELLKRKSSGYGLENREFDCRDPPRWLLGTPLSSKIGTNFAYTRRSLGWYNSLVDLMILLHEVLFRPWNLDIPLISLRDLCVSCPYRHFRAILTAVVDRRGHLHWGLKGFCNLEVLYVIAVGTSCQSRRGEKKIERQDRFLLLQNPLMHFIDANCVKINIALLFTEKII